MGIRTFRTVFVTFLVIAGLTGCTNVASHLMLPADPRYDEARAKLAGALTVGAVTGGTTFLNSNGVTADEFRDALIASARTNGLLAENASSAKYRVEAKVDFEQSGTFEKQVDTEVLYRLFSIATNELVLEKSLHSKAITRSQLKDNAGVVVALLFTSVQDINAAWTATFWVSARSNLESFFKELSEWRSSTVADEAAPNAPSP